MLEFINNIFSEIIVAVLVALMAFLWNKRKKKKTGSEIIIWEPNGKKVYFVVSQNGEQEAYVYDVVKKKRTNLPIPVANDELPSWSPDGKRIALVSNKDKNKEIYIINADGSNLQRITFNPADDICPEWSPDGKQLTFISKENSSAKVTTVNIKEVDK